MASCGSRGRRCAAHPLPLIELLVVHEARVAADELVERFLRLPVAKTMNLGTRAGFDRAVGAPSRPAPAPTGRADVDAVREAIAVLDVDWAAPRPPSGAAWSPRRWPLRAAATAIVPARIEAPFNDAAQEVVAATRTDARADSGWRSAPSSTPSTAASSPT